MMPLPTLYDADLVLKAPGVAVTATADYTAVNLGARAGVMRADIVITAIVINDNNEKYDFVIQGSPDGGTTWYTLGQISVGATETLLYDDPDTAIGREVIWFSNQRRVPSEANGRPDTMEDIRLSVVVAGTTPSITFEAFLTAAGHGG